MKGCHLPIRKISFNLPYIKDLIKWIVIVSGVLVTVNTMSLAVILSLNQNLDLMTFVHLLLICLMFEGIIITLIGCIGFFGWEKYRKLLMEEKREKMKQKDHREIKIEIFLVILGFILFFISFLAFSFL